MPFQVDHDTVLWEVTFHKSANRHEEGAHTN